jgi:hypothetical protein
MLTTLSEIMRHGPEGCGATASLIPFPAWWAKYLGACSGLEREREREREREIDREREKSEREREREGSLPLTYSIHHACPAASPGLESHWGH